MAEILICKEVHRRDIYFDIVSVQYYHLTSMDAEPIEVRSVDALTTSHKEADTRIILQCMHICKTTAIMITIKDES